MKRAFAFLLTVALLLCMFPAQAAKYDPPGVYDIRIRSRSSRIACLMRVAKEYMRTSINYISLDDPITISMIDTSPSMKGKVVALNYMLSNKGRYTTQHIVGCRGLHLTCDSWPHVTIEGSYELPLLVNGGTVNTMRIDGGQITFEDVTITGVIELRGENTTVDFVNCVFDSGAKVQASPTVTIMENGTEME